MTQREEFEKHFLYSGLADKDKQLCECFWNKGFLCGVESAKAQAVLEWIPVCERWPEYGEHVLMLIPTGINYVVAGFISCDEQEDEDGPFHTCSLCDQYGDDIGYSIECLSHWMPLPAPPEKNK